MRYLLVISFLLTSFLGFGQSVTAPEPKSFTLNTSAQDASGFSLSGFGASDNLLCAIGLPSAPSGTTFYITTTTGLTAASGFTLTGNKTKLVFTGTMANINNALATLKINTNFTIAAIQLSVSATVNPSGYYYNPTNGHFYKPVTTGNTYTGARAASLLTTFKGQSGYLVTITSADEDNFIIANVPQSNIWFACTDEVTEGRWIIDAGPEKGTLIKTSNGQTAGNIQGQYNNWAPGEPNNSGNEDYPVTKWSGGTQWNDLPDGFYCAYVIEYGTWTNPDNQTFTGFYSNSVNHSNGQTLRTQFTFDFGSVIDETKFKTKIFTYSDYIAGPYNEATVGTSYVALNGLGKVDMTAQMDTTKISNGGLKANTTGGQTEWCVIYSYDVTNQRYRVGIDSREVNGIINDPSKINSLQLFDLWNGPVTFVSYDPNGWTEVYVYTNTEFNFAGSTYASKLRAAGWGYGVQAEFTFSETQMYKSHAILFESYNETQLQTLLGQIVTVGDVYLAFKEYSDNGIMGNESKYFTSGIQFQNADVNHDNVFDERDCYKLLKHLQGTESLWASALLPYVMKIIPSTTYDSITKQNWNTFGAYEFLRAKYPFTFSSGTLNSYSLDVTWEGDVNLSHSSQPSGFVANSINQPQISQIKTMSVSTNSIGDVEADIMMEKVGDSVIATIFVNSNGNQIGATQYNVFFDNSILDFSSVQFTTTSATNFNKNNGSFISIGSLNTTGGSLSNIGYKIVFKPKITITNLLGLISVNDVETLDTSLKKLNVKVL